MKKRINISVADIINGNHYQNQNYHKNKNQIMIDSIPSSSSSYLTNANNSHNSRNSNKKVNHQQLLNNKINNNNIDNKQNCNQQSSEKQNEKNQFNKKNINGDINFDTFFVQNHLYQEIQAAQQLNSCINKGQKFQKLFKMAKNNLRKNSVTVTMNNSLQHQSSNSYTTKTNQNYNQNKNLVYHQNKNYNNCSDKNSNYFFSKKCTPQNSGRVTIDTQVLHRSLQKQRQKQKQKAKGKQFLQDLNNNNQNDRNKDLTEKYNFNKRVKRVNSAPKHKIRNSHNNYNNEQPLKNQNKFIKFDDEQYTQTQPIKVLQQQQNKSSSKKNNNNKHSFHKQKQSSQQKQSLKSYTNDQLQSSRIKDDFNVQFQNVLAKLNHNNHSHIRQVQCFLNEKELEFILIEMHYLKSNSAKNMQGSTFSSSNVFLSDKRAKNKYCQKIFSDLGGNIYGGVVSQNIQQFLRIIQGINLNSKIDIKDNNNRLDDIGRSHFIDQNLRLKINQKQRKLIHSQYFPLRTNRVLFLSLSSKKQKQNEKKINVKQNNQQIRNKIQYKNVASIVKKDAVNVLTNNNQNQNKQNKSIVTTASTAMKLQNKNPNFKKKNGIIQDEVNQRQIITNQKGILQPKKENITQYIQQPQSQSDFIKVTPQKQQKQQKQKQLIQQQRIKQNQFPENSLNNSQQKNHSNNKLQNQKNSFFNKIQNHQLISKKKPILSVDVNLGSGVTQKIIVYEGQSALQVANRLQQMFKIDQNMKMKFQKMLEAHIRSLLWKIQQVSQELISDRQ